MSKLSLSLLDLASVGPSETIAQSFAGSVALARLAEALGYRRVWYAEHHSIDSIASAATSVLIAHVAAHTTSIRLGAGGVMLPNHSPLTIAEQFGTLAELHPGRIDLGLGRAPGGDPRTLSALRRDSRASERFPEDVVELQALLSSESPIPGVRAIPGAGTNVPLYILGSSLFGAELAASLGLPYAFASHFAPAAMYRAIRLYRQRFVASQADECSHLILGINVIAAETESAARAEYELTRRLVIKNLAGRSNDRVRELSDAELLRLPQAAFVEQMFTHCAVGTAEQVATKLGEFQQATGADELMTVHHASSVDARLRSVRILGEAALLGS